VTFSSAWIRQIPFRRVTTAMISVSMSCGPAGCAVREAVYEGRIFMEQGAKGYHIVRIPGGLKCLRRMLWPVNRCHRFLAG
jgi:hypothetical protein